VAPEPAPRILFGHSLGGLIALSYLLLADSPAGFDALALSSPFLESAQEVPALRAWLASVTYHLAPKLLGPSPVEARNLSHDPAVVAAYEADPLVFKTLSPRWYLEVRRVQEAVLERAGDLRLPVLLQIGSADPIAAPARARQVFERLGSADKQIEVYQGFLHEVFNETGRQRVMADLLAWLARHT
jgi:alpha-beta hydrolase superfamily lysophospholipase